MESGDLEVAGATLRWIAAGDGASVVIVHGLAADAETWASAIRALAAGGRRGITYDRRGYGASSAPEPYAGTTVEEQAEDLAALLRALAGGPAVLVGDGFGALVVLDVLKRYRALAAAAVLSNPSLFAFVPAATEVLSEQRRVLDEALREGGPAAAVAAWLGGRAAPDALARAQASARGFFADYAGLMSWSVTRRELRALDAPAVVASHPQAPPHIVAAADALATLLPDVRRDVAGTDLAALALGLPA